MSGVRFTHVLFNSFTGFFKFKHNWGIFCFVLWGWLLGSEGLVNRRSGRGWGDVQSWAGYEFHTYPHPAKKPTLPRDIMVEVVNSLGLKLLAIHNEHNENNIAISPYGSLSILVALGEGLQGEAVKEVQKAAHLPNDISLIRIGLRDIHRHLKSYFIPKEGFLAGLTLNHYNVTLRPQYEEILKFYGFDIMSFNTALYPDPPTTEAPKIFTTTESPGREMTVEMTTPLSTTTTSTTTPAVTTIKEDEITSQKVDTTTREIETTSQKIDTTTAVIATPADTEQQITTTVIIPKETTTLTTTVEAVLPSSSTTTESTTTESSLKTTTESSLETTTKSSPTTTTESSPKTTESSLKTTTKGSLETTTESSLKTTTESSLKTTTELFLTTIIPTKETLNTTIREDSTTTEVTSSITTPVPSSTEQAGTTINSSSESTIKMDVTTLQVTEDSGKEERITDSPEKSTLASTTATETTNLETNTSQIATETTKETIENTTEGNQRESTTTVSEIENATREQQTTDEMSIDKITTTVNTLTEQITTEQTFTESTDQTDQTDHTDKEQETTQKIDTEQPTEPKPLETTTSVNTETTTLLSFPYPDSSAPTNADITTELSNENEINISDGETSVRKRRFRARKNFVILNNFKTNLDSRKTRSVGDYVVARYYDNQPYRDNFHPVHYPENYHLMPYVPQTQPSFFVQGKYAEYNVKYMKYDTVLPFFYASHLNAFALSFPLDSDKYYLLLLLPVDKNGINRLICDMRLNGSLKYVIDGLRYRHVTAIIPSFMLKGYVNLTPTLQKLGIRRVFEPGQADFSPMTALNEIYITNIEQAITVNIKNYVDPDALNNRRDYREDDPQEFRADHPFLYFVMDTELHVTLMAGKIVNPLNSRIT